MTIFALTCSQQILGLVETPSKLLVCLSSIECVKGGSAGFTEPNQKKSSIWELLSGFLQSVILACDFPKPQKNKIKETVIYMIIFAYSPRI